MRKQKGIALFQVILITSILILLATYVTTKAQQQVESGFNIANKQIAMLKVKTTLSKVKFHLLSKPASILHDQYGWNFYGEPFNIDGIEVTVQDHNGLIYLNQHTPISVFENIIKSVEQELSENITVATTNFQQWFIDPNNVRIQNLEQLTNIGFSYDAAVQIWNRISVNPKFLFNPANTPDKALNVLFSASQAMQIKELRPNTNYIEIINQVEQATGITNDEETGYITGPYFRVKIKVQVEESSWHMLYELSLEKNFNGLNLITLSQRPS